MHATNLLLISFASVARTPTPSNTTFSPKQISCLYFKPCLDEHRDPRGTTGAKLVVSAVKHPKTGYTNLVSHVRTAHPSVETDMRAASVAATGTLLS
ncbi:hypothetical protein PF008_g31043 [Phytophthora fragariae]|uniref:Secreted protein n=1 Tax=Phytophthora fragariae TaxID=53985 RepID=A0A6G0Q4L0_9STRA|nr:hypothetical protein PF008_g31043 [Phytophthora fragariae]